MKKSNKFSPEVRERAVRMVFEHRGEYPSLWATIESIAPKIGCVPQTLHDWIRKHEIDTGMRDGMTCAERERVKALGREVRELRKANEILRGQRFFRPGGARPPTQVLRQFIEQHRDAYGVEPICKVLHSAIRLLYLRSRGFKTQADVIMIAVGARWLRFEVLAIRFCSCGTGSEVLWTRRMSI